MGRSTGNELTYPPSIRFVQKSFEVLELTHTTSACSISGEIVPFIANMSPDDVFRGD